LNLDQYVLTSEELEDNFSLYPLDNRLKGILNKNPGYVKKGKFKDALAPDIEESNLNRIYNAIYLDNYDNVYEILVIESTNTSYLAKLIVEFESDAKQEIKLVNKDRTISVLVLSNGLEENVDYIENILVNRAGLQKLFRKGSIG
jgi:hypothetical protein|tara:strand:- start:49 stop:483 length:435 start_codon:yes stop_codon:yes gene_type:complete